MALRGTGETTMRLALISTFVGCMTALATLPASPQSADNFPSRPVRLIVPFPAGGPTDMAARLYADVMSRDLGQPIVVENRAGGNSVIGAQQVARAPSDGYTIMFAMDTTLVLNPLTMNNLPYNPMEDFTLLSTAVFNTTLFLVREDGPKTFEELIAFGKKKPGGLTYGAGLINAQVAGLLFNKSAGIEGTFVPYKGSSEVSQALLNGSLDYSINAVGNEYPMIAAGKVRALAKLNNRPLPILPELKLLWHAANLPDYGEISTWSGFVTPRGVPDAILNRLQVSIEKAALDPSLKQKLGQFGIIAASSTTKEFEEFIVAETAKWRRFFNENNLKF